MPRTGYMPIGYLHVSAELNLEECQATFAVGSTKRANTVDEETVVRNRGLESLFPVPLAVNRTSVLLTILMISRELTSHATKSRVRMNTTRTYELDTYF
jgi:hypothetical protein